MPRPGGQTTLLVVSSVRARRLGGGRLELSRKFITGLEAYAALWPGKVAGCVFVSEKPDDSLDLVEHDPATAAIAIRESPDDAADMAEDLRDVAVALVNDDDYGRAVGRQCLRLRIPYVHMLEWDPITRRNIVWQEAPSLLRGARRLLRSELTGPARVRSMKAAAGLQCNGTPTYDAFRRYNARSLLYFDSRVTREMVVDENTVLARTADLEAGGPLRLVFSGRLIAIKGADHLPRLAAGLARLNVPFTLDICGGGVLEAQIERQVAERGLQDRVRLRGTLAFEKDLLPLVSQHMDLFVCCHLQGDPSCTYLETMSCGVPIAGYANPALSGFVQRADLGWTVPTHDPDGLAQLIADLGRDRARIARASHAARVFALHHTFDNTMRKRVDHLLDCSDLRPARRNLTPRPPAAPAAAPPATEGRTGPEQPGSLASLGPGWTQLP